MYESVIEIDLHGKNTYQARVAIDAALRRALVERLPGKTQIIVAQRIATVMRDDKIIVLEDGAVVGQGAHAELLRSCDQYREIAYSQLSPEELDGSQDVPETLFSRNRSGQEGQSGNEPQERIPTFSPTHPRGGEHA